MGGSEVCQGDARQRSARILIGPCRPALQSRCHARVHSEPHVGATDARNDAQCPVQDGWRTRLRRQGRGTGLADSVTRRESLSPRIHTVQSIFGDPIHETSSRLAVRECSASCLRCPVSHFTVGAGRRHHQGRHPALAVGNDGHLRDGAQGRRADDDRRDQRQGRRARQEARAGGGRPGLELAAVRREGQAADRAGQGRRDVRLLDQRVAQVGAAGGGRTQRPAVLPGAVRRRRAVARTCSTPARRRTSRRFRRWNT